MTTIFLASRIEIVIMTLPLGRGQDYMILTGTIMPYIVGVLSLLFLITFLITVKSWRDAKRSPFFFQRRQAQKQMQTYATSAVILFVLNIGVVTYSLQTPTLDQARYAILASAKPPVNVARAQESIIPVSGTAITASSESFSAESAATSTEAAASPKVLPEEFDQVVPKVELTNATDLGQISFSTSIDNDFVAVQPQRLFEEGFFTIYATFAYEEMADGMAWSWVWRFNGEVIGGGNELWAYGDAGPGYIFLQPEEGFQPGEYDLQVWVNGELQTQSSVFVTANVA
ncbi:MAG: hypothetical protein KDE28_14500, partial [Anaerolineales bacterium]|nr:hypothetical protein [Anaerolineales bacterium]